VRVELCKFRAAIGWIFARVGVYNLESA